MTPQPRTLVIGDVHGCLRQLDALLISIAPSSDDHLIFLGDLVDRGTDSAGVIKTVLKLSASHRVTVIKGNHEQMMLDARNSHDAFSEWLRNGGDATLKSYAGMRGTLRDVPTGHWEFLETRLVNYLETPTHLFVHANAYPDMAMNEQPDYMLRWERCDQISPHGSGKTIVCGHTPQKSGRPMNRGYAICIDTHACGGKFLTCLEANSGKVWQAGDDGKVQRWHIADFAD